MAPQAHLANPENFECFGDILASALIDKISTPSKSKVKVRRKPKTITTTSTTRSNKKADVNVNITAEDTQQIVASNSPAEDLTDFTDYIATLAFEALPSELRSLTHRRWTDSPSLHEKYSLPLTSNNITDLIIPHLQDLSLPDSLVAYGILSPPHSDLSTFLAPVLTTYLLSRTTPPPAPSTTKSHASACELCERDWVPLTYHHLIPRFVHAKAVKRGWHREEDLNNVAWLCRACHSFVHRFAGHEVLAREYFTVERLLEAEEVRRFAQWVARVRWKAR